MRCLQMYDPCCIIAKLIIQEVRTDGSAISAPGDGIADALPACRKVVSRDCVRHHWLTVPRHQ